MVGSLEILLSDALHAADVVAVAEDAIAVAIRWEVEGHREFKMAETPWTLPQPELKILVTLTSLHCRDTKGHDSVCIFSFSFPTS